TYHPSPPTSLSPLSLHDALPIFSCPNNSDAISDGGIAAQLTRMKARFARFDRLWIARAINSLPVLVSPCISTVESVEARESCLRSEEHTSELQSRGHLVCRLLLE